MKNTNQVCSSNIAQAARWKDGERGRGGFGVSVLEFRSLEKSSEERWWWQKRIWLRSWILKKSRKLERTWCLYWVLTIFWALESSTSKAHFCFWTDFLFDKRQDKILLYSFKFVGFEFKCKWGRTCIKGDEKC